MPTDAEALPKPAAWLNFVSIIVQYPTVMPRVHLWQVQKAPWGALRTC